MRTPGRCTNHEACWLADGNRDVWVSVADDFRCPVCGTPLEAPPMAAISHRGFGAGMSTSLGLMLLAGGLGFGLVQILRDVAGEPMPPLTALSFAPAPPRLPPRVLAPGVTHAPSAPTYAPPTHVVSAPPPVEVVLGQVTLQPPVPQIVTVPVAAPGPMGPEEFTDGDTEGGGARWHRHAPAAARAARTYVLPAPGGPEDSAGWDEADRVPQPAPVTQDDDAAAQARRALAAVPVAPADMAPTVMTTLTVPAAVRLRMKADQPAERVDAGAAAAIDDARDAPARLAGLPVPPPDKLAVPAYPDIAAEDDRPGRVAVGCTISVRGEPTACQVRAHAGGMSFVSSVLDWLHSGSVRYKPHFLRGTAVPELRLYKVKFEP